MYGIRYAEFASKVCQECAINTYSDDTNVDKITCLICSKGQEARVTGVGACTPIPGLKQAKDCDGNLEYLDGRYSLSKASTDINNCIGCTEGKFSEKVGADKAEACLNCPAGYVQSSVGGAYCLPCTPGKHQPDTGQIECQRCEPKYDGSLLPLYQVPFVKKLKF